MFKAHIFSCLLILYCNTYGQFDTTEWLGENSYSNINLDKGIPYIRNYTPKEYTAQYQNWAIIQDKRGIMYFGNNSGILEFDGASWRTVPLPNGGVARSFAKDKNGTIYVGGEGDFGYLASDSTGQLQYVSLLSYLDNSYHNFHNVWNTLATSNGIYFSSDKYLFRWANKRMKVWEPNVPTDNPFIIRDTLYILANNAELLRLEGDTLKMAPGGEYFGQLNIREFIPYGKDRVLIAGREKLFLYDGKTAVSFPTEAEEFISKNKIYRGHGLPHGMVALGTKKGGVVVIDRNGDIIKIIDKASGLQDDNIRFIYSDQHRDLWLGLDKGISRIELFSPFTFYKETTGFKGSIYSIIEYRGTLYISTSLGVYFLESGFTPHDKPVFKPVNKIDMFQCWHLLIINNVLFAVTNHGIYQIQGDQAKLMVKVEFAKFMYHSKRNKNLIFVGHSSGLYSFGMVNDKLVNKTKINGISENILGITESTKGQLWLSTKLKGIVRIDFSSKSPQEPFVNHFNESHGLPSIKDNKVYQVGNRTVFATQKGVYRFDQENNTFNPDSIFKKFLGEEPGQINTIVEDNFGNIWIHTEKQVGVAKLMGNENYKWENKLFSKVSIDPVMYPQRDGITWFGGYDALIRYNSNVKSINTDSIHVFIRKITVNGDSVIYGGSQLRSNLIFTSKTLTYQSNLFRFEYASPGYDDEETIHFQYLLEGYDKSWSDWSKETMKEYTNVPKGNYRFHVRAKNISEHISSEDVFEFKILPPWYKSMLAYSVYLILFLATGPSLYFWRIHQLKKEREYLEQIIADRTVKITEQNKKLLEMDEIKSNFFANISHNFRTPLTLILGPVEHLLSGDYSFDLKKHFKTIRSNALLLLRLINQLLDLSKLEAGKIELKARKANLVPFLKGTFFSFTSLAEIKQIDLQFHVEQNDIEVFFDLDKFEEAIYNLLNNAFKFTPAGGQITMQVTPVFSKYHHMKNGYAEIVVKDTGNGISQEKLPYIFDRFYQAETTQVQNNEGTGIGLAITKELIELHHGTVHAESMAQQGSKFIICLPLGKEHLKTNELLPSTTKDNLKKLSGIDTDLVINSPIGKEEQINKKEGVDPGKRTILAAGNETLILVVEDNADVRSHLSENLTANYIVVEACNGQEGVKKAFEIIPDLVISDVMMPLMNGFDLCQNLKKDVRTSHIPIILLTAKATEKDKLKGLEFRADDYITKPFRMQELLVRVKNLVDLRRQLHQQFRQELLVQPSEIKIMSVDEEFLHRIRNVAEKYIGDIDFDIDKLSKETALSYSQLFRKLRALTGQTPSQFIRLFRIKRAAQLIMQKSGTISEIAYDVGFNSTAYFTKCFKEVFGKSPSAYQADKV